MTPAEAAAHPINELIRDLWEGRISEARFTDCALHEGMSPKAVNEILAQVRQEDGELT